MKLKTLLIAIATLGLMTSGLALPAQAGGGPSINLVDTNDSLSGSAISGYSSGTTLRLAVISNMGTVTWTNNGSGANLVSNSGNTAQGLWLEGTQDQLNAAMAEITVNKPCAGSYKIYAQVSDSGYLQDPTTGHLYSFNNVNDTIDQALADAAATPLVSGGTNTFGYVATVTSPIENIIVSQFFGQGWLGASDSATEGDWKWIDGPEAGTSFYSGRGDQGGVAVNNMFNDWNSGEPNDWGGGEDNAEILSNGTWNDIGNNTHPYTVEWGGMPGDDLSPVTVVSDNVDISVVGAFSGAGTEADPYLIPDATALHAAAPCGGPNVFFKQTANITLPNTWTGDQSFDGHYDGNGKTITYSANTPTHSDYGIWGFAGQNDRAYIHDLTVTGDLDANNSYRVGLVVGYANNVDFTNITVDGNMTAGGGRWGVGGVAGVYYNGTMDYITSTVDITFAGDNYAVGGIAGEMDSTINHSTWSGTISAPSGTSVNYVGGLAGNLDCGNIYNSSSAGSISVDGGDGVAGLVGYGCGVIQDSHSSTAVTATSAADVGGAFGYGSSINLYRVSATGNIVGSEEVGGLFGYNSGGEVYDVYARGNVTSANNGGSLAGSLECVQIQHAYSTGAVTAQVSRGAIGNYVCPSWSSLHWVPEQSTITVPGSLENGEVPYTLTDAKSYDYYNQDGWDISTDWSNGSTWTICSGANDGYPVLTAGSSQDPCAPPLTNATAPTITGTGVVGKALSMNKGNWDSGVTFTYQWKLDGSDIAGATAATYTPVDGDVGKTVTVSLTGTKQGFRTETKLSSNSVVVTAAPVIVVPTNTEVLVGGFRGNAWWMPAGFMPSIKAAVKAHSKATALTCTGIVAPGGNKAWLKTLGLKRATLACAVAKSFNGKLKVKLAWRVAAAGDAVKRGAGLKFNK